MQTIKSCQYHRQSERCRACTIGWSIIVGCLGCILGGGCEVGPNYKAPVVDQTPAFDVGPQLLPTTLPTSPPSKSAVTTQPTAPRSAEVAAATQAATRATTRPVDLQKWWISLDDSELNSLVTRAVHSNLDIGISLARLQQARASYAAVSGGSWPLVDASAGLARGSGSNSTRGRVGAPLNAGTNTAGYREITEVVGFDAGWELNLFGLLSRQAEAAQADVEVTVEERNQVLVSILAELTRAYIDVRSEQLRLKITQDNIAALRRTVDLTRVALQRGIGNELNVVLAERQLSAALSRIAPLSAAIRESQRQIAVLLGEAPESLYSELDAPVPIPTLSAEIDPGFPLDLVRRRPDVRRAERMVAASTARIGVATAYLFPDVAVTAGWGFQGQGLGRDPVKDNMIWSIGPAIRVPLLDFGRLDALVQYQDFQTQALLLSYKKSVITAVEEVENALGRYSAERNRFDQLTVAVASSQQAVNLATQRYNDGLTDFLNVLDAQRQLYDLEDQLAASQQTVSTNLIALFKALGGGWEALGTLPAAPTAKPAIIAAGAELVRSPR